VSSQVDIRWARDEAERAGALGVRREVFCREQGVPLEEEVDGLDGDALHLVALTDCDGRVVGTLRLLFAAGGAKVGRVAVEREWRRRGIAAAMLQAAVEAAGERGCHEARLAAQTNAVALYEQAGFAVCSEPFEQAGIEHVWMRRGLAPG
jgi:putative N-acetyltransferase (TIGR04045 family)